MPSTLNKNTWIKRQDAFALLCLGIAVAFLLWKAPFSYGLGEDESFFLAFPHRLVIGDSLFTDEWNKGQFFAILLYWPVKAFKSIAGSTEGMILFFRYFYVAFQSAVSTVIYILLRKYGYFGILAAIINCLHIPFTYLLMSYNTMGFAFTVLAGVLLATRKTHSRILYFITGILIACAVLCNPLLAALFILYTACMILFETTKHKKHHLLRFAESSFTFKSWIWITLGVSAIATVFILFVFSRTTWDDIIANFPMILTDPKLDFAPADYRFENAMTIQKSLYSVLMFSPFLFATYGLCMAAVAFDKKRLKHRLFYLAVVLLFYFAFTAQIILTPFLPDQGIFLWMLPLALLGLTCYVLSVNKEKNIFAFVWVLGLLYALCLGVSSDIPNLTSPYGLGVSAIASVIFVKILVDEMKAQKSGVNIQIQQAVHKSNLPECPKGARWLKGVALVLIAALVFQAGFEVYINADVNRYSVEYAFKNYWPADEKLDTTIQTGPLKGIRTTPNTAMLYRKMIDDLDVIRKRGSGPVLIAGAHYPWCYFYLDMPYATYSTEIFNYIDNKRLQKYYELHGEKRLPKYIYVAKLGKITIKDMPDWLNHEFVYDTAEDIVAEISTQYKCDITQTDVGYIVEIEN